jgi:molecular chaperone DnaK
VKNRAEAFAYETEKSLREHGDKVPAELRANIESALNNLKDAIKSDDADRIKKTMELLQQASLKLGEEVYKATAAKAPGAGPSPAPEASTDRGTTGGAKKDEDVIDAEYEVKE